MPPKGNVIIKKDIKKNLTKLEASLKSADDGDLSDDDDYESEDFSEVSDSEELEDITPNVVQDNDEEDNDIEEDVEIVSSDEDVESAEEVEETEGDEACMYKKAKVKNLDEEDDEELELVYDDDNIKFDEIVKPEDRITKPYMTIFERVRLLGDRAKQLSLGAKPMIKGIDMMNPKEIAKLELEKGVIPLIIERLLPNGKKERWHVNELLILN
jgi:DNA-directed RNA polymerase subunit K/omega